MSRWHAYLKKTKHLELYCIIAAAILPLGHTLWTPCHTGLLFQTQNDSGTRILSETVRDQAQNNNALNNDDQPPALFQITHKGLELYCRVWGKRLEWIQIWHFKATTFSVTLALNGIFGAGPIITEMFPEKIAGLPCHAKEAKKKALLWVPTATEKDFW